MNLLDGHPELAVYPSDVNFLYGYFPVYLPQGYTNDQRHARFERVVFAEIDAWLANKGLGSRLDVGKMRDIFFSEAGARLEDIGGIIQAFGTAAQAAAAAEFYKWQNYKYFFADRYLRPL